MDLTANRSCTGEEATGNVRDEVVKKGRCLSARGAERIKCDRLKGEARGGLGAVGEVEGSAGQFAVEVANFIPVGDLSSSSDDLHGFSAGSRFEGGSMELPRNAALISPVPTQSTPSDIAKSRTDVTLHRIRHLYQQLFRAKSSEAQNR